MALSFWYQTGGGAAAGFLLPLILIFVILYFLLFLPTQRQQKRQQQMLANLKSGDRVVTSGGIRGTIVQIKDEYIHLKVPPSDIKLEIARSAVAGLLGDEEKAAS